MSTEATTAPPAAGTPPADRIAIQLLTGMWAMQAAASAARLRIPDIIGDGARTPEEVAREAGTHPGATKRLLRGLASLGVFRRDDDGRYRVTEVGRFLRSGVPGSIREMFIAESDTLHWRSWERLDDAVRTGDPRPKPVFGLPGFDYYAAHPEEGARFGEAMESISRFAADAVLGAYDFSSARTLMDVGGGNGSMAIAVLQRTPGVRGLVVDLPYIEGPARERIRAAGLEDRCRFEAVDFFERVPEGADVHMLKFVLHDWNDEESLRILKNCRAAIAKDGRLVVIENVVPESIEPAFVHLMDLNMLVMTGGLERTEREYADLFAKAGFRLSRVVPTPSPFSVVEARPV
jgi:SAM-dependent methyltransferase